MPFKFGNLSETRLIGVHPDLVKVMRKAIATSTVDFRITEGRRTYGRQKMLVRQGKSTTLKSRHLTGHAVDVVPIINGQANDSWSWYYKLAPQIKQAANSLGISIEWGGDWRTFKDGPHFQLSKAKYPE